VFPSGGGCTLTFPLQPGDECLVVFASRCIDGWWQSGGSQLPMEPRMHDLSDGFAIPGPRSKARPLPNVSTSAVQLRSDDGQAYVQLNPGTHEVDTVTPGKVTVQAGGDVAVTAGGNATVAANSIALNGNTTINGSGSTSGAFSAGNGASGVFKSQDGHTVTVSNGIITKIL
jgi:phage baseplate assembly protein gpV